MIRLNELEKHDRLDLIKEARWQNGSAHVGACILDNSFISELCDWSRTRQGVEFWEWIDAGSPRD